jgi:O-antigen ligase
MAFYVFTLVGRPSEWIPGFESIPVTRLAILAAAIVAFRVSSTLSPVRLMSLPNLKSGLLFMGLAVVSILWSIYRSNSLSWIPGPLTLMVSMILLVKVVPTVADAERILVALVAGALALTIGTLQVYQGGRAEIGTENMSYDPNDLAFVLVTMLPIALALFDVARGTKKWLLLVGIGAMLFTILITGSRGGTIALVLVALLITFKPIGLDKDGRLRQVRVGSAIKRVFLLMAAMAVAWVVAPPEIKDRLMTLMELGSDYNTNMEDNSSRLLLWKRNSTAVLTRPIGFGLGSSNAVDGMLGGLYKAAHNTLVQAFTELGFLGLFLLLRSFYVSWRDLKVAEQFSVTSEEPLPPVRSRLALYSRALRISLVGCLAAGFFLSQAYGAALWMLITVCAVFVALQRAAAGDLVEQPQSRRRRATSPRSAAAK